MTESKTIATEEPRRAIPLSYDFSGPNSAPKITLPEVNVDIIKASVTDK